MASAKRKRQKANRAEREQPVPQLSDADLEALLVDVTVRADCEHASTRTAGGSMVLVRCAVGADELGGCPVGCAAFEPRRAGPSYGLGAG